MSKLLHAVALTALFVWTGAGFATWVSIGEHVSITVAEDGTPTGAADDPVALLRDEVGTMAEDIRALAGVTAENFQRLAGGVERAADGRSAALQVAVAARLDALEAAVAARHRETVARLDGLGALAVSKVGDTAAEPSTGAGGEAARAGEPALEPSAAAELDEAPAAAAAAPRDEMPPAELGSGAGEPPPRSTGFLPFHLPSDSFRFDALQHWKVIPSLSRIGFDAKSTLHDFSGVTSRLGGELVIDLSAPDAGTSARVWAEAAALNTGHEGRNEAMREHLDSEHHARIEFEAVAFRPDVVDPAGRTVRGTVVGRMTIRGVTRELEMTCRLSVDDSRRLLIEGSAPLRMSDYGVPVPSKLGIISVEDQVAVWVALRARIEGKP